MPMHLPRLFTTGILRIWFSCISLQALVQCVFRATRHRNAGHQIRNLDRISVLPGSDHAAAQVTICHYPFKEGI